MMKVYLVIIAMLAVAALGGTRPAAAQGPCTDIGAPGHSDYAMAHIVPLAHEGMLGAGGHIPGEHHGYSLCNPSGK